MKKKLLNPRGYLSWTQVDMWLHSKDRYVRRYFLGEDDFQNEAMALGKRTSEALESGEETGDFLMDAVVTLLPHYKEREHEIRAPLKTPHGIVELLGKLDTFESEPLRFREYKTGRVKWTQARANKHRQLHHYASLIYLKHGRMPEEVWLDWIETDYDRNGKLDFTGGMHAFHVKLDLADILEYMALVSRVAQEIDVAYRKHMDSLA